MASEGSSSGSKFLLGRHGRRRKERTNTSLSRAMLTVTGSKQDSPKVRLRDSTVFPVPPLNSRFSPAANIAECHGSVHWAQCAEPCSGRIWPMSEVKVPEVDTKTFHSVGEEVPRCPHCKKAVVRPNVLMFGDGEWIADREEAQESKLQEFIEPLDADSAKLLIIEIGAGTAVPTIRLTSERTYARVSIQRRRLSQTNGC